MGNATAMQSINSKKRNKAAIGEAQSYRVVGRLGEAEKH